MTMLNPNRWQWAAIVTFYLLFMATAGLAGWMVGMAALAALEG